MRVVFLLFLGLSLPGCTRLFYQPDRFFHLPPAQLGYAEREVRFQSRDGVQLLGWSFLADTSKPKGLIVQFHGNGENMSSHYASLVWLVREGYDLFTFDYRGYGRSEGEATPEGVYLDSLAALDQAQKLYRGGAWVLYGQSLGGAVVMRALEDHPARVQADLVVVEAGFLSYKGVARQVLSDHWLTWIFSPLGCVLVSDEYSAKKSWPQVRVPALVIHDQRDPIVRFSNGQEIFSSAANPRDFWKLDDGRHIAVFAEDRPENRKRFLEVLKALPLRK